MTDQDWDELTERIGKGVDDEPSPEYWQCKTEIEYVKQLIRDWKFIPSVGNVLMLYAPNQYAASIDVVSKYEEHAAAELKKLEFELKALELKLKTLKE